MSGNPFDQFDAAPAQPGQTLAYVPKPGGGYAIAPAKPGVGGGFTLAPPANPFDQFDPTPKPSVVADVAQAVPSGLIEGAKALGQSGVNAFSLDHNITSDIPNAVAGALDFVGAHGLANLQRGMTAVTNRPLYTPQTIPGKYANTIAKFAPNALGGGGNVLARAAGVAIPAIASEAAGQATAGTRYEGAARLAGALAGGLASGVRATAGSKNALAGSQAADNATLRGVGVQQTPGVAMGGLAKNAEDLAQRFPIAGPMIRGARARSAEQLNRGVALTALAPVGETLPKSVPTGAPAVGYVRQTLGRAYDKAADLVPAVGPDKQFGADMGEIRQGVSELPTDLGKQFENIVANRMTSRLTGPVTGRQLRQIQSSIAGIAAKRSASDDVDQQALGEMLEGVSDSLKGLLGRANPEAGKQIEAANKGWAVYVRLRNASARSNGGMFSAAQLSQAVKATDKSVGKGAVAEGNALLQNISGAASRRMPDAFGNPGTADAVGLGALAGEAVASPAHAAATAAGLAAAGSPYLLMARRVLEQLPQQPTRAQAARTMAQLNALARRSPKASAVRDQAWARLAPVLALSAAQSGAAGSPPQ